MTEDQARAWLAEHYLEQQVQLARYVEMLLAANATQNLISRATEPAIWTRHILDSAQLIALAPDAKDWLDVGSGAGLPGIVIAILTGRPVTLVEPRRKRVEFLRQVAADLGLSNAMIECAQVERLDAKKYQAVTARAYTNLASIFSSTVQLTTSSTIWVLPKGRSAEEELAAARKTWHGVFHVEHSLTDADARIIVATGVRPR